MRDLPVPGPCPHLAFAVGAPLVPHFFLLLQQGVLARRRVGCRIDEFLRDQLGAAPDTVERIQSVMLDGRPVDDIGAAVVQDGSTLALSAAMPGLVGATLRRGGAYSSLRSGITHHESGGDCRPGEGWVRVKLFNLVMADLGPELLRRGVAVAAPDLLGLLAGLPEEFWRGCAQVTLDGSAVDRCALQGGAWLADSPAALVTVLADPGRR